MATRQSVDELLQKCEEAVLYGQEQYNSASRQEHYDDEEFTSALQMLESAYNDLVQLALSANSEQRELLHRKRLQLQQLQNSLILLDH